MRDSSNGFAPLWMCLQSVNALTECGRRAHEFDAGKVIRVSVVFPNREEVLNALHMLPVGACLCPIFRDAPKMIGITEGTIPGENKGNGKCATDN